MKEIAKNTSFTCFHRHQPIDKLHLHPFETWTQRFEIKDHHRNHTKKPVNMKNH